MTSTFIPTVLERICFTNVVLPAPRKPVMTVTGRRPSSLPAFTRSRAISSLLARRSTAMTPGNTLQYQNTVTPTHQTRQIPPLIHSANRGDTALTDVDSMRLHIITPAYTDIRSGQLRRYSNNERTGSDQLSICPLLTLKLSLHRTDRGKAPHALSDAISELCLAGISERVYSEDDAARDEQHG